ncbi:Centrosomal protein of 104 kDa [Hondaea fermentalgiana]|uniref:Centrosomal protein of 104 kDa n=1 Tax=Hondaea fermentalgiana TaxID=2315210 RepID=A0A2R5GGX3_9STRA|nr:Centrosomal protein of 104 kDa [Hondaea fermentalgiana]|eukprot:GBG30156.1 Centrosomal protein of 104 kDa [Hondaea fermentalgiana]
MIRGAGKSKAVAQDDEDRLVRYQVCGWTSQDGLCPAEALEDWNSDETNQDLRGWCTESFCVWPQEIELSFPSCTRIDDIEIVAHSFRTPRSVDVFVTGFQTQGGAYYIGRMSFDSNLLQDHTLNECKRARVDAYGTGLILRIPECYSNKRNLFDQASTKLAVDTSRRGLRQRRRFEVITNNIDIFDERENGYDHAQMTEVDKALLSLGIAMNVINTTATPYRISETTAGFVGGLQDRVEKLLLLEEDCLAGKLDISQEELLDAVWRLQSAVDELLELGTALARFEALLLVEQDGGDVEACNKLRLQIESVACAAAEDFESIHGNCVDLAREPPMSARSDNFERELPQAAESRLYDASEEIRLTDEDKSSPVEAETRMSNGTFRSANTQYIAEEEEGEQKSNEQDSSYMLLKPYFDNGI